MLYITDILQKLVDNTGRTIQCGFDKGADPRFLKYLEAIHTPFIRFGNSHFIPALSIDIDNHKDHSKVLALCEEHGLPLPTFILDTTKGLHVHWVLNNPIPTNNVKVTYFYQQVISTLVSTFNTDLHAVPKNAGRLFRNPLLHPTKLYNDTFLSLKDFSAHTKLHTSSPKGQEVRKKSFSHYKKPDFSKINTGSRNTALFDYGRAYAYKNNKAKNLQELLIKRLSSANNAFPQPVPQAEITELASSITTFIHTRYTGLTKNKKTIEFNRKLNKKVYDGVRESMLIKFFETPTLTIKDLKTMSLRRGGELFGVHKNTFKKHLLGLIDDITTMSPILPSIWEEEPEFKEVFEHFGILMDTKLQVNST